MVLKASLQSQHYGDPLCLSDLSNLRRLSLVIRQTIDMREMLFWWCGVIETISPENNISEIIFRLEGWIKDEGPWNLFGHLLTTKGLQGARLVVELCDHLLYDDVVGNDSVISKVLSQGSLAVSMIPMRGCNDTCCCF